MSPPSASCTTRKDASRGCATSASRNTAPSDGAAPVDTMSWTCPDDLAAQVRRLWDQGRLLACAAAVASAANHAESRINFPLPLRLRRPSPRELGERFDAVRSWIEALEAGSRSKLGAGYEIVWEESSNRQ